MKVLEKIRRYMIVSVVIAVTLSIAVYAEFTMSKRAKRVIASYSMVGDQFSSNILKDSSITVQREIKYVNKKQDIIIDVTVCNYPQNNRMSVHPDEIEYTITAQLWQNNAAYYGSDVDGASVQKIIKQENGLDTYGDEILNSSATETLPGKVASTDRYRVIIPSSMVFNSRTDSDQKYIKVTATTSANGVPNELLAYFGAVVRADELDANWNGAFSETSGAEDSESFSDYDGFNYIITGNGTAEYTLMWNPDILVLNKESYSELGIDEAEIKDIDSGEKTGWKKIELSLNSADIIEEDPETHEFSVQTKGKPRYAIQFFRNTSNSIDWTKSVIDGAIEFSKTD